MIEESTVPLQKKENLAIAQSHVGVPACQTFFVGTIGVCVTNVYGDNLVLETAHLLTSVVKT